MKDIIQKAKELNICHEWQNKMLKHQDMKYFCEMYFKGDDWAMEHDFPTLPLLQKYKGQTEEHGLYLDYKGTIKNKPHLAFFGDSNIVLEYDNFQVALVNIRHQSKAKIIAKDYAIITINVLDNAQVEIEKDPTAKVFIYKK